MTQLKKNSRSWSIVRSPSETSAECTSTDTLCVVQLTKLDLKKREVVTWKEDGWMPGEPVFVPEPGAAEEDKGKVPVSSFTRRTANSCLVNDTWRPERRSWQLTFIKT